MSPLLLKKGFVAVAAILAFGATTQIANAETRLPQVTGGSNSFLLASGASAYFTNPPSLGQVSAVNPSTSSYGVYQFTVSVPSDAGRALKAVRISQQQNLETFDFDLRESQAFTGNRYSAATAVPLASVGGTESEAPGEVTIAFAQPVQPGTSVTISLTARHNPVFAGVYNFAVTAYPEGDNALGQMIGLGRINLYGFDH
jgi:hypothetical protein